MNVALDQKLLSGTLKFTAVSAVVTTLCWAVTDVVFPVFFTNKSYVISEYDLLGYACGITRIYGAYTTVYGLGVSFILYLVGCVRKCLPKRQTF